MEFKNKIAIVTGAAKGIGRQIAAQLIKGGATVIIADVDGAGAKKTASELGNAEGYCIDVTKVDEIRKMASYIKEKYGTVHILVNNAGIYGTKAVEDITEAEWDRENSINLKGQFFLIQSVLPMMLEQHYGKIVNLSSIAGRNGGVEAGITYSASKSGVIGMTRGLAARLAPSGINVNCVAPGPTMTDMFRGLSEEQRDGVKNHIPLRRFGEPEDIAYAVEFMVSDRASFVTGAVLDVNGGMYMG